MTDFMTNFIWFASMVGFPGLTAVIISNIVSKRERKDAAPFGAASFPSLGFAIRKVVKALVAGLWVTTILIIIGAIDSRNPNPLLFISNTLCACVFVGATMLEPKRAELWHCTAKTLRYEIPLEAYREIVRKDHEMRKAAYRPALTLDAMLSQLKGVHTVRYDINEDESRAFIFFQIENTHNTSRIKDKIEHMVKHFVEGKIDG